MLTALLVALNEHRAFVVSPRFLRNYFCEVRWLEINDPTTENWTSPLKPNCGPQANSTSTEPFATCFDTDVIIGPPACQAQWGEPGGIKARLFGPDAPQHPSWTAASDEPVVMYTAQFLQSVKYHKSRPWNQDQPIAVWRYPVPVDGPEEERTYFPLAAWKLRGGRQSGVEVGVCDLSIIKTDAT